MTDPDQSHVENRIRREEETGLRDELVNRLHQHGVFAYENESADHLADLLSAIDMFEKAVEQTGGDLFVDSPDSSEPERPEYVLPHMHEAENITTYIRRIRQAAERLPS
jgi:hypothetical protein